MATHPWYGLHASQHCEVLCAALANASFGGRCRLTELVAVLFVLVHLVVRNSLSGHAAILRFVFEGLTVAPLPGHAR